MYNKFWKPDRMIIAWNGNSVFLRVETIILVRGQNAGHTFHLIGLYIVLLRAFFTKIFMEFEFHFYAEPCCKVLANFNHPVTSNCPWITLMSRT